MAHDVREFRFKYGPSHVIVTVDSSGVGDVRVLGVFLDAKEPTDDEKKLSLAETINMLSIARHLVWEEYTKLGGTVEELATQRVKKV